MLWSKNNFFYQSPQELRVARKKLVQLFELKNRKCKEVDRYLKAFDYFAVNPSQYDGATIVKDLVDIRNNQKYLDTDAMLHDYDYIHGANKNFVKKWVADIEYIRNMEKQGKGIRVIRFSLLLITGIFFVPYKILF